MENSSKARVVGLFGFVGLAIIGLLLINFSRGAGFWKSHYEVTVKAEGVGGLKPGAHVMMSGVPVGTVSDLTLAPDGRNVLIDCEIESKFEIRADARFEIEQSGFLGDQYVSITPTENRGAILRNGGTVIATKPFNMNEAVRGAVSLMQRLEGAAGRLDAAMARIDKGVLSDGTLGDISNTVVNVRHVSERAESTLRQVEDLIRTNAPGIHSSISNVQHFTVHLNEFATKFDGVIGQVRGVVSNADTVITSNRADLHLIVANVRDASQELKSLSSDMQAGRGAVGLLLKDPGMQAQVQGIAGNLMVLSSNLSRHGILWKPRDVTPLTNHLRYPGRSPF